MYTDAIGHVVATSIKPAIVMVRGEGSYLFDSTGRRYLDFIQGWAVNALGHSPPALARVVSGQSGSLWHASPTFYNGPQLDLSRALAQATRLDCTFLCTTGAEANESAIKLARKWGRVHRNGAYGIITTHGAFHGRTLATMSASGKPEFEPLFEPKVPGFRKVAFGAPSEVEKALDTNTVAVMVEPIQGEAGVVVPPSGYLRALREITERSGILLILDEVQTGMGRTGRLFAFQDEEIRPDILTVGKGLGAGLPLAAMVCTKEVSCFSPGEQGGTHVGNAFLASVGNAVLEIVGQPDFLASVRERGDYLEQSLTPIARQYGGTLRGRGLLWAMVLHNPVATRIAQRCLDNGLIINAARPDTLRFMPSLTVSKSEIDSMVRQLSEAFEYCPA